MTYIVELKHVRSKKRFWAEIERGIPVPDYFGENLDALYDVLSETEEQTEIIFRHAEKCANYLPAYIPRLKRMCKDLSEEIPHLTFIFEE